MNGPTWQEIYYIVAALCLAGGAVAGTVVWLFTRFTAHERDLSEFKLKVAEDYATTKLVERVESRMTDAVNRVADQVARMNAAFHEAVRMMMRGGGPAEYSASLRRADNRTHLVLATRVPD